MKNSKVVKNKVLKVLKKTRFEYINFEDAPKKIKLICAEPPTEYMQALRSGEFNKSDLSLLFKEALEGFPTFLDIFRENLLKDGSTECKMVYKNLKGINSAIKLAQVRKIVFNSIYSIVVEGRREGTECI